MFIDNLIVSTACPKCNFENPFTLKQARLQDIIICRGCKSNIQLHDQMNECKKATRNIDRAIQELTDSISVHLKLKL